MFVVWCYYSTIDSWAHAYVGTEYLCNQRAKVCKSNASRLGSEVKVLPLETLPDGNLAPWVFQGAGV